MFALLTLRNTPPCPLRSHRGSATQAPKKAFYHLRFAPMMCIFLGVLAPQWHSVPLRSTPCRRRKNEKKRRGKGISGWLVAVCHWWPVPGGGSNSLGSTISTYGLCLRSKALGLLWSATYRVGCRRQSVL